MKKQLIVSLLAMFALAAMSSSAFAAFAQSSAGTGELTCGATNTITVSLSPKVEAGYTVANNAGINDWYVIGTYHQGGTKVYATASTVTKIWNATADTTTTVADLFDATPQTPDNAGSDTVWSDAGWDSI